MLNDENDNDNLTVDEDTPEADENVNDSDPTSVDYMEGAEVADKQKPLARKNKNYGEEIIPSNVVYSQPHRIQKNPNELAPGQIDNFENPYRRATANANHPTHQKSYATGKADILILRRTTF